MTVAIVLVAAISIYQEARSTQALRALRKFTQKLVTVVRDGVRKKIPVEDIVPRDIVALAEGDKVPADGIILQENDLTVNEAVITGESFPREKQATEGMNMLLQGTTINSGSCIARISATGNKTLLGQLGRSLDVYQPFRTLLQQQIDRFVKMMAIFGFAIFLLIWLINYARSGELAQSLLFSLTLAMATVPEEIPVAFSSFMALGALHMAKLGIISRQPQIIESLGAVSVICLDKTGTLTENRMEVRMLYDEKTSQSYDLSKKSDPQPFDALTYAMLASERDPFDMMEVAIHDLWWSLKSRPNISDFQLVHDYPLHGRPPMMTHVFRDARNNNTIAASKGAIERILAVSAFGNETMAKIKQYTDLWSQKGYRLIGVASAVVDGKLPERQDDFKWKFEGLLAVSDPLKINTRMVFSELYDAGIGIKILTGDHPLTTVNIAKQAGMKGPINVLEGSEIMKMTDDDLKRHVADTQVFARMFPDAKLKVIEALKADGEIVAMMGDGVNDGPALIAADIGIAMGKRGTDIARQAADLILTDDNLDKLVEAVRQGRKIFNNLHKALRYIISIHIPIILTAILPLLLGWKYLNIFTPIHVIMLELIMGPTCSIFFEKEPVEDDFMLQPPRKRSTGLFTSDEFITSTVQGVIIAAGVLILYRAIMDSHSLGQVRAIVFTTLVIANMLLTFTNRSFTENIFKTSRYRNLMAPWIIIVSTVFLFIIHLLPAARSIFGFEVVHYTDILLSAGVAIVSVIWFEVYKTNLPGPDGILYSSGRATGRTVQ